MKTKTMVSGRPQPARSAPIAVAAGEAVEPGQTLLTIE